MYLEFRHFIMTAQLLPISDGEIIAAAQEERFTRKSMINLSQQMLLIFA